MSLSKNKSQPQNTSTRKLPKNREPAWFNGRYVYFVNIPTETIKSLISSHERGCKMKKAKKDEKKMEAPAKGAPKFPKKGKKC